MYFMIDLNTVLILTKNYVLPYMKSSSFAMDEDPRQSSTSSVKTTTEAFKVSILDNINYLWKSKYDMTMVYMLYYDIIISFFLHQVVGSVLYFTAFSLDKLGQPLVNENPQLTDGWDIPMYLLPLDKILATMFTMV